MARNISFTTLSQSLKAEEPLPWPTSQLSLLLTAICAPFQ